MRIYQKYIKRAVETFFALLAIVGLSPILIIIALLVRLKLGSPILFKPKRPGINGDIFTMYKFRTMTDEKNESGELLPDKERITKFGRFLRSASLDELPELFNIIKGEMSLVGPRPLSVKYLPYYTDLEMKRHYVRPGLTGLAQINGRNKTRWEDRFALDIDYVENVTFINDLQIIFKTILEVVSRKDIVVRGTGSIEDFHDYRIKQNRNNV